METPATTINIPMSKEEARDKTEQIRTNIASTRYLLLEMHDREGWKVLGYGSWREYGQIEFGYSERRIYQLALAARVEKNLCTIVQKDKPILEGQLRPLTKLGTPELQQEAWQKAVETAPDGKITARHVSKVVGEIMHENIRKEVGKKGKKMRQIIDETERMDEDFKHAFDAFYWEVQRVRMEDWKTTSKEAALRCVKITKDLIEVP